MICPKGWAKSLLLVIWEDATASIRKLWAKSPK